MTRKELKRRMALAESRYKRPHYSVYRHGKPAYVRRPGQRHVWGDVVYGVLTLIVFCLAFWLMLAY